MTITQQPDGDASTGLDSEPVTVNSIHTTATMDGTQEQVALRAGALLKQGYH